MSALGVLVCACMCVCARTLHQPFVAHPSHAPFGPRRANRTANVSSGKDGCRLRVFACVRAGERERAIMETLWHALGE